MSENLLASLCSQSKPHGVDPRNGRAVVWYRVIDADAPDAPPIVEGLCYADEIDAVVRAQIELLVLPQQPAAYVKVGRVELS